MRIIHTSDWHLGKSFGPISLRSDQEAFTDWFVGLVADQSADLVVIAGDLYDRAIAPVESIELFGETMCRLLAAGVVVAAIAGNHDGADRVAPYSDLLDLSRFYLRGGYDRVGEVITHEFADGPLDLALMPFLDPQAAPDSLTDPVGDLDGSSAADNETDAESTGELVERRRRRTHESVLRAATGAARSNLRSPRSIAVAHAYVSGAKPSDSERQLVVGGTGEVPASLFDGFSYTALGHLHRPQRAGSDTVRYSGTPLAYSFSEDHDKSVLVIDMDPQGSARVDKIGVDVGRRVQTIRGTITELEDPARFPEAHDKFVRAVLTDRATVLDARSRLSRIYPHIAEIQLLPGGREPQLGATPQGIRELKPIDAARTFWKEAQGSAPGPEVDSVLVDAAARALARSDA